MKEFQGNVHMKVSPELYKELRELSGERYMEGMECEFTVIPVQLFVGTTKWKSHAALYVGDSSKLSQLRIEFDEGEEYKRA